MDRYHDEPRFGEKRFTKDFDPGKCKPDPCDPCKDDETYELGKEMIQSALSMENSLAAYIAGAAKKPGPPGPCSPKKSIGLNDGTDAPRLLGFASAIEVVVLIKLLIGIATVHHDKMLALLCWMRDNLDLNDIDFKKIMLFFKNQDWDKMLQAILAFLRNNTDLQL